MKKETIEEMLSQLGFDDVKVEMFKDHDELYDEYFEASICIEIDHSPFVLEGAFRKNERRLSKIVGYAYLLNNEDRLLRNPDDPWDKDWVMVSEDITESELVKMMRKAEKSRESFHRLPPQDDFILNLYCR